MSTIKFIDGQTIDSDKITRVSVLQRENKLFVETAAGPIKIQGAGVQADLALPERCENKENLHFLVHEK